MSDDNKKNSYQHLWDTFKRFLTLKTEDLKFTLAEKATIVISTVVVLIVLILLGIATLTFLSFSLASLIASALGTTYAYLILGGFYALLISLVILLRKPLIIDPVARFVTRVILS